MMAAADYVVEDSPEGRALVLTGQWSQRAAAILQRGDTDGLVLNYARGFSGSGLDFLGADMHLRRLDVLDRSISDLAPIERIADSLEALSVQASPGAELDLGAFPHLRSVAGEWDLIGRTLSRATGLREIVTWQFSEADLHAFRDHFDLQHLTIKEARNLESLDGLANLSDLRKLGISLAPLLCDISEVTSLASSLAELEFEQASRISSLAEVGALSNLRFLGINDCGEVESFAPLAALGRLEVLYVWGTTRVGDKDLSPLSQLPALREVRMQDRAAYTPRLSVLQAAIAART